MIKAIIFDLDDTLFEEKDFVLSGFKVVAKRIHKSHPLKSEDSYFETMKDLFGEGRRGDIFNETLDIFGIDDPQIISELVTVYRQHVPDIKLCPDAKTVLFKLKNMGYKIGLVTDGYGQVQRNKTKALGIENSLDIIIYSDDYGIENWKPSELPYKLCLEGLNVTPDEAIFVGDNPSKDFITANELGIWTIRIKRKNGQHSNKFYEKPYIAKYDIWDLNEIICLINTE